MKVLPLTAEHAYQVADAMCAPHRSDVLRDHSTPRAWADDRLSRPGVAWAVVRGRAIIAGGVETHERDIGVLWLAGVNGWTRYVKHAIRIARAILSSGAYRQYRCEVHEADHVSRRFAERLGFREIRTSEHLVLYGVTP